MANNKKRIEEIYHLALEKKNKKERSAYLDSACGDDSKLRAAVEGLLQAHDKAGNFLEVPPFDLDVTLDTSPLTEGPGTTIGNYKLLEQIGEGGMAVVYMAEQKKPIRRKVALKIIKLGMDTKEVTARFEVERQALAMMEHPNIAKVLDAGTTNTGRPYFVMELVKGVSITDYCDKNKLSTKERLNLFISVCNAVQHAHQKGIIHRDIKPSNVMITLRDGKPVPKVIDFGIAKATSQRLTEKTLFTRYAQMIGTPTYMSPEQAEFSELDIDTRTDIYSLGVLLYELLTGTTPFSEEHLREAGYLEMQRIIREEEPLKPSTKLSTLGDTLTDVAEYRKASPDLLQKLVRGDLDWIVMKSLEKDRTRRYNAAAELVADIVRHLNDEPVLAGPPSQIYRLRKFVRRHRTHAIGAAMATVLLAGMAVISAMYIRALSRGEEAEFLKHKDILSKAMEFRSRGQFQEALTKVEDLLSSKHVGPKARLLRARLILELQGPTDAVKELEKLLKERDEIACQAHLLLARIYLESASGVPEKTEEYLQKAKEHQQQGEKLFPETAEAYFNQAMIVGTVKKTLEYLNKAVDLEPGHYPSRKARALGYYAIRDYRSMEWDAVAMTVLRDWDSLGYSLLAIALRETEYLADAVKYHNKAIDISPSDAELYDQRRRTHMRMANYKQALSDARRCIELEPKKGIYHFHAFCALVALGRYDEAEIEYNRINVSGLMEKSELDIWAGKYACDTLDVGLSWHPPENKPEGAAFLAMHESDEIYHQLVKKAKRVVLTGYHPTWSPNGTELAYSRGVLSFSGIEIVNLENGKTRLLTVPGFDPAWSPDGKYIAFTRHRQHLLLGDLTAERTGREPTLEGREVWLIKADGTEEPRFLGKGYWPYWSRDSNRVLYHSPRDMKLYSISVKDGAQPVLIIPCPSSFPAVSPDEKYIACRGKERQIVELSTNSVVARWTLPMVTGYGLLNWSPDGQELSMADYRNSGLWIYDMRAKKASKVLSGSFAGWCSWSPDMSKIAIERGPWSLYQEIWVADLDPNMSTTEALGPGQTIEEHCQEMVEYYTRRIDVAPEDANHYSSRAKCYFYLGDQERTIADLETYASIVKNPSWAAHACDLLAWSLIFKPQKMISTGIAVKLYQKALELQPSGWWYLRLGLAHYRAGQWEEAVAALTEASNWPKLRDRSLRVYLVLSMAHWQSGNKAVAADWYNKAIEQVQKTKTDISLQSPILYSYYLEAAELMGIKIKGFDRKAPLTGKQIVPITARADTNDLDITVDHIFDGNGLADMDGDGLLEHDANPVNMWLSKAGSRICGIEFDLGAVYELGTMLVWNYNEKGYTKWGIKMADISVWTQEAGWKNIFDDFEFSEAEGSFDYDEPTVVRFDGVKTEKVRFDDLVCLDDKEHLGLGEVRFFQRRGPRAIRPYPSDGTDIAAPTKLSWMPGLGVKAYQVYLGTNPASLDCIVRVQTRDSSEVKLPKLEKYQRYWWRVDAEKADGSVIKGELWSFVTGTLVSWWTFDQVKGEIVPDSSGNDLHGRLIGNAHIISEPVRGNVLSLDGRSSYVDCGTNAAFDITDEITVAAWINIATVPTTWTAIVTKGNSAWRLSTEGNQRRFHFAVTALRTPKRVHGGTEVAAKEWHHVCGTYDGANIRLYVDGIEDTGSPVAFSGKIDINGRPLIIGANAQLPGREWNGLIDDVRIYSYALTEAEVKELYAGRGPGLNEGPE